MFKILLALHLLFAVFAIGPLVHAATTASRGVRTGDAAAAASCARVLRIYGIASVVVVALGIGLMSAKRPSYPVGMPRRYADYLPTDGQTRSFAYGFTDTAQRVADFGDLWIWLSLVLWAVSLAIVFALLIPSLQKVPTATAGTLTARVAAGGGVVALIYAAIVFLMVYRPGG